MGWERRGPHLYYYRALKSNGRVVKEYVGHGPLAEATAAQDEAVRDKRRAAADAQRTRRTWATDVDRAVDAADASIETLVRATLVTEGYHRHHRGEWRRRRTDG